MADENLTRDDVAPLAAALGAWVRAGGRSRRLLRLLRLRGPEAGAVLEASVRRAISERRQSRTGTAAAPAGDAPPGAAALSRSE